MGNTTPSIATTKDYIVIKIPRRWVDLTWTKAGKRKLTERDVLKIVAEGERDYKKGKTIKATSLKKAYYLYKKSA